MSILHCWEDRSSWAEETYGWGSDLWMHFYRMPGATCLLLAGHAGPHEWTPDSEIGIAFGRPTEDDAQ